MVFRNQTKYILPKRIVFVVIIGSHSDMTFPLCRFMVQINLRIGSLMAKGVTRMADILYVKSMLTCLVQTVGNHVFRRENIF